MPLDQTTPKQHSNGHYATNLADSPFTWRHGGRTFDFDYQAHDHHVEAGGCPYVNWDSNICPQPHHPGDDEKDDHEWVPGPRAGSTAEPKPAAEQWTDAKTFRRLYGRDPHPGELAA